MILHILQLSQPWTNFMLRKKHKIKIPVGYRLWLEKQDAYTLHKPVTKHFPSNPYTVNKFMDMWECDLVDIQAVSKFHDNYKNLLTVIDVFSEFLHNVPLNSTIGPTVTSAFKLIFKDKRYSKPVKTRSIWVRTDKGKEFLNTTFRDTLKHENILPM
jgi:hypothetical protein